MAADSTIFYHVIPMQAATDFSDVAVLYPGVRCGLQPLIPPPRVEWRMVNRWPGVDHTRRPVDATHFIIPLVDYRAAWYGSIVDVPLSQCIPTRYYYRDKNSTHRLEAHTQSPGRATIGVRQTFEFVRGDDRT